MYLRIKQNLKHKWARCFSCCAIAIRAFRKVLLRFILSRYFKAYLLSLVLPAQLPSSFLLKYDKERIEWQVRINMPQCLVVKLCVETGSTCPRPLNSLYPGYHESTLFFFCAIPYSVFGGFCAIALPFFGNSLYQR